MLLNVLDPGVFVVVALGALQPAQHDFVLCVDAVVVSESLVDGGTLLVVESLADVHGV